MRDYVDARHSFSEWILAVMMMSIILIMMLSMLGNKIPLQYQAYMLYGSSILMYGSFIVTAIEAFFVWRTIKRVFTEAHPREDIPSGTAYYAFSRMIMRGAGVRPVRRSTAGSSRSSRLSRRPAPSTWVRGRCALSTGHLAALPLSTGCAVALATTSSCA